MTVNGHTQNPKPHAAAISGVREISFEDKEPAILVFENSKMKNKDVQSEQDCSDEEFDSETLCGRCQSHTLNSKTDTPKLPQVCASSSLPLKTQKSCETVLDPYGKGFINGREATILRDSGSTETIVKHSFVHPNQFTKHRVQAVLANNSIVKARTAYVQLVSLIHHITKALNMFLFSTTWLLTVF